MTDKVAQEKALQALHSENERLGLYKDAYAEQEPQDWKTPSKEDAPLVKWVKEQTPPQRTWVGLTDEQKKVAIWTDGTFGAGALWAEAKLKEKNT